MIFSILRHVEKILSGEKVMTRRIVSGNPLFCKYRKYHTYAVQPGRGKKAVARIEVIATPHVESRAIRNGYPISEMDAKLEGGYTPEEYEALFEKMHPNWQLRSVIAFKLSQSELKEAIPR
jgi:hypothetical protein